jgi:transcriptional regulator with XRE-family HTH domain
MNNQDWSVWMQRFGRQSRRVREFLGLPQEEVARLAGVSQGAVSRLENGRGTATPFVVILKINGALARELRKLDPALLDERMQRALAAQDAISPPTGSDNGEGLPLLRDRQLHELIGLFRSLSDRQKPLCLSMVRALVEALVTVSPP